MRRPGSGGDGADDVGAMESEARAASERRRRERRRPRRGEPTGTSPTASPEATRAEPIHEPPEDRSLVSLLKELRDEGSRLLRQEVALAKAEIGEKIDVYRRGMIALGIGIALLLAALLPLVETLVRGLTVLLEGTVALETAVWLAPLIVALVLGAVGYAVLRSGSRTVSEEELVPRKTVDSLKEDKRWVEEKGRDVKRSVEHG